MPRNDVEPKDVYERVINYVTHNTGREPLGIRAPAITGGVSRIVGGTTSSTVEHQLELACKRGELVRYADWSDRYRYLPVDADVIASVIQTEDLHIDTGVCHSDALRTVIARENTRDESDMDLITDTADLIREIDND